MLTLDSVVGLLAPHLCIACGAEGKVLCRRCIATAGEPIVPRCMGCYKISDNFKTCNSCKSWLIIDAVIIVTAYEGIYEQLIKELKFDSKRLASQPIAQMMSELITTVAKDTIVCPLPTAPARIRERGFDHTKLIAKQLAVISGLNLRQLLGRNTNVRQLGSSRSKRLKQMEKEFHVKTPELVKGKNILLVDDVVTTGASLSGATKALKKAGAKKVQAIVFAQKL